MGLQASIYAVELRNSTPEMTEHTLVGASVVTEGYWNSGLAGVALFPAAHGVLLGLLLGHNDKTGDVSVLVAMTYLASTTFLLQAFTTAVPNAVTLAAGVSVATFVIAPISNFTHHFARRQAIR